MKNILFAVAIISLSSAAYAGDTSAVVSCVKQVLKVYNDPGVLLVCQGVRTESDVDAVVDCVKQVGKIYAHSLVLSSCQGVKD